MLANNKNPWWDQYIGIPYQEKGRDISGMDCWGLVRHVYAQEFYTQLPSFTEAYDTALDREHIAELLAVKREGWVESDVQKSGDVAIFRIIGQASHVGIITQPGYFLHVIDGQTSTIERLDALKWKNRLVGVYRYTGKSNSMDVVALPHPLKTYRIDTELPQGFNLLQLSQQIQLENNIAPEISGSAVISVNGFYIPQSEWAVTIPAAGSRIEYRATMQGGRAFGAILVAVAVIAIQQYYLAPALVKAGITGAAASFITAGVGFGLTMVGGMLLNAIFPVRPPSLGNGGDASVRPMNRLQGGANQANPFGAIPVVLGRMRYTPPVGALPYVESNGTNSYLKTLLVWGYGPLQVSDLRIANTPIEDFAEVELQTLTGWNDTTEDKTDFNRLYSADVEQLAPQVKLEFTDGTNWTERTMAESVDKISVELYYPSGLFRQDKKYGTILSAISRVKVQVRQVGETAWGEVAEIVAGKSWSIAPSYYNIDSDAELEPVYRWHRVSVDKNSKIIVRTGAFTASAYSEPSGKLLTRLQQDNFGFSSTFKRLPDIADEEEELYQICTYGSSIFATLDRRGQNNKLITDFSDYSGTVAGTVKATSIAHGLSTGTDIIIGETVNYNGVEEVTVIDADNFYFTATFVATETGSFNNTGIISGCDITYSGLNATIASGVCSRVQQETIYLRRTSKTAFSLNVNFNVVNGIYEVRAVRISGSEPTAGGSILPANFFNDVYLQAITGYSNRRAVTFPKALAMTAARIKATNQINGNVEGITGTVQSICKDWDAATSTWVLRPTRNPASLVRWVLQHPANAKAVADSKINLVDLQDFHAYCVINNFTFDTVLTGQQALLDTLRDICAAGRASPTLVDGKWTVIIDRPRSHVAQHFTPHNSWGFEGARTLPIIPHAFRVTFLNEEKGFQADEIIVYNDGYSSANATLFEALTLNGVTKPAIVHKQARFHMAQIKLRPETYTLNADIEHLVCTRGDLVKVTHDVPMWGLGSARIKNRISSTVIELDEEFGMDAGVQYTVRIRLEDGSNITRTVAAVGVDGYYAQLTLTSSVTALEAAPTNLVLFGALNAESVDLIVQSIEPNQNMTARLTLVDYSPAVYDADSEVIPAFDSKITKPPVLLLPTVTEVPVITRIVSDESVMDMPSRGQYIYNIRASYTKPATLDKETTYIESQFEFADDNTIDWQFSSLEQISKGAFTVSNVQEGSTYKLRARFVNGSGIAGRWCATQTHTVTGKLTPPDTPTGLSVAVEAPRLRINWADNTELDVIGYELRDSDSGWGGTGYLFKGTVSSALVAAGALNVLKTWYVKAYDAAGLYSTASASVSYTVGTPDAPDLVDYVFADTSLTNATVTLNWTDVAPAVGLKNYEVNDSTKTVSVNASVITLPANWLGNRTFTIKTVDALGNKSDALTVVIAKLAPSPATGFQAQVIDNNVMLYWTLPAKTTLPISHVLLKKGATWATATQIGTKSGAFTSVSENTSGTYTYWIAVVDTDNNQSTPVSISAKVAEPPDFIFKGRLISTLTGTKNSAITEFGYIVLPLNTSQTFEQHFTSNGWASPQAQITAGYPYYAQPSPSTSSYVETFDYGTIIASSSVVLNYTGEVVAGTPTIVPKIELSDDNVIWQSNDNVTQVFGTNFRYVRITIRVDSADGLGLYKLEALNIVISSKLKNDAGNTACVSSHTNGTIANFNFEFIDVASITVTPLGTTPVTAVYDFQGAVLTGTYSVTSNVATINVTGHGLIVGQKVRLNFTSGTAPSGIYTVATTPTANQYTVALTTANTSGNISTYPQSMRIYLFNNAGARVSGTASWAIKGN